MRVPSGVGASKRRFLLVLLVPLALVLPVSVEAQGGTGILTGTLRSSGDGSPVSTAFIRVVGLDASTSSDATGRFRLEGLPAGPHTLRVERLGYETREVSVDIPAGGAPAQVTVELVPEALLLEGVVASASGEVQRRVETAASISRIDGARIRETNPSHPSEILNRVPGVWVSPTSTEGHMTAIRQPITTKPVYLFLEDGVPTRSPGFFNHNALYEVNVPQSGGIEVIRGPGTALYGSDAIGGVIDVSTRPAEGAPRMEGTVEGSSLRFGRLLATASGTRGDDGFRLDLNLTEGDRWRDDARYDRQSATLRWDRALAPGQSLRTTVAWSSVYQEDPSVISRDDLSSNPEVNYHPITFRSVDALRVASRYEHRSESTVVQVTPFLRWNTLELMPSWMLGFDPVVWRTGHASLGLMTRVHRAFLPAMAGRLTVGIDLDRSPGSREEHRIELTRDGPFIRDWEQGALLYDYDATFLGISPYAQVALRPVPQLHLTAGLRYDRVGFDYETRLPALQEGSHRRPADTSVRYDNLGPSLGLALTVRPEFNAFASFRESFRAPSEGQLFRQGAAESSVTLNPVQARNHEVGIRGEFADRLGYEVAFYLLDVKDDILSFVRPEDGTNESVNAGRTRHQGVELGLTTRLPAGAVADVSWTRASHRYLEWSPRSNVSFAGNRVEAAPRNLGSARLRLPTPAPAGDEGGFVELEGVRMGSFWMDPANENRYEGHVLWNLRAELPVARDASIFARVQNVADRAYAERASFNAFRGEELSPGRPRSITVGLRWGWTP
jgi:iron complex outermembrane recepter protein